MEICNFRNFGVIRGPFAGINSVQSHLLSLNPRKDHHFLHRTCFRCQYSSSYPQCTCTIISGSISTRSPRNWPQPSSSFCSLSCSLCTAAIGCTSSKASSQPSSCTSNAISSARPSSNRVLVRLSREICELSLYVFSEFFFICDLLQLISAQMIFVESWETELLIRYMERKYYIYKFNDNENIPYR